MDKIRKKSAKVEKKNKAKSKEIEKRPKKKNQIMLAARARLEPRLSLSSEKNKEKVESSEKNKEKVESSEKNKEKVESFEKNKEKVESSEKNKEKVESSEKNKEKVESSEKNKEKVDSSEKNKEKVEETTVEKDKKLIVLLNANEVEDYLKSSNLGAVPKLKSPATTKGTRKKKSDSNNLSSKENQKFRAALKNLDPEYCVDEDYLRFLSKSKLRVTPPLCWTDKEIKDLAYALQYYGFANIKEVAAHVKTKTENDVKVFVQSRIHESRKAKTYDLEPDKQRGRPPNAWSTVNPEVLETWPNVRKWKRLAYEQMLCYTRNKDYSKPVISALCEKFYEEEPEPVDPQLINVKLIYKYISDCMNGSIPPQLPPKESALVLDLLREARLMPIAYDFEEETQFLKNFKHATTFKPFQVKDEFRKKLNKVPEEINDPNTVSVPEEIFSDLSRHKRLLQSFNPLTAPVWLVQKEQEHLEKYFKESSVYVD